MISRTLETLADTEDIATKLSVLLREGDFIALRGGLGAGKTTFSRALISALLGEATEVPSPTYTLVQTYEGSRYPIFHFDLYRLDHEDEVHELGWDETVEGLALVEWPDNAGRNLPRTRLDIHFDLSAQSRTLRLEPIGEDWQTRLHGF